MSLHLGTLQMTMWVLWLACGRDLVLQMRSLIGWRAKSRSYDAGVSGSQGATKPDTHLGLFWYARFEGFSFGSFPGWDWRNLVLQMNNTTQFIRQFLTYGNLSLHISRPIALKKGLTLQKYCLWPSLLHSFFLFRWRSTVNIVWLHVPTADHSCASKLRSLVQMTYIVNGATRLPMKLIHLLSSSLGLILLESWIFWIIKLPESGQNWTSIQRRTVQSAIFNIDLLCM